MRFASDSFPHLQDIHSACVPLQERHNQLLADYGRQVRVADIARTVQREAATALSTAHRSASQVPHIPSAASFHLAAYDQ